MPYIRSTKAGMWWAAGNPVQAAGCMEEPGVTVTGLTLITGETEATFLAAVAKRGTGYKPLVAGDRIEAQEIRSYGDELVIAKKAFVYTGQAPKSAPDLFFVSEGQVEP